MKNEELFYIVMEKVLFFYHICRSNGLKDKFD